MADVPGEVSSKKHAGKLFNPKIDPEAYNYVATRSSLLSIQLISSSFDVTPDFFSKNNKLKIDLCHDIVRIDFYQSDMLVAGIFRYEVIAKIGRKHALSSRADFLVLYQLPEEASENETKAFCCRVGLFAAYPYFRALFSHWASAGNVDLPILPVLSADPLKRKSGRQSTEKENPQ